MRPNVFTLTLDKATAERVRELIAPYGGTVPQFCRRLVEDFSQLNEHDQFEVRALMAAKLQRIHAPEDLRPASR